MNWGIIGLGNIARAFTEDLMLIDNNQPYAVASRTQEKADAFGAKFLATKAYDSYATLFQDEQVDIVYIATPHDSHVSLAIEAMNAGKHVLCEKPLAVNAKQVQQMIEAAQANDVFLMEAFWSRFNPSIEAAFRQIQQGELGEVNYINADFTFYRDDPDTSRMLSMDLAGGSLLDMGVYPVFLAYLILGKPEKIHAISRKHKTGADLQTAALFEYPDAIANLMSGFQSQSDMIARICGTKGSIFINPIWHETQSYTFLDNRVGTEVNHMYPTKGKGFTYEIEECIKCIEAGLKQSPKWSWQNSLDLITLTDEIRNQIGLHYPFE